MTRALYISYDGMTDPLGQSQVIPYLAGLSKMGFAFHLISCEKGSNYVHNKTKISKLLEENNITWHPISYTKKPPVLSTLWDIYRIKRKAYSLHKTLHFSIVHCRSYIASLIGLRMKKDLGVKFIFDMRGFWADERVEGSIWSMDNPFYRTIYNYFKRKEIAFLSNADYTISLTEKAKHIIHARKDLSGQPIPVQVIPCCVDIHHFSRKNIREEDVRSIRNELKIRNSDLIISYLGSIGTWYCLDEMLIFFKHVLNHKPNAIFLFITPDDPKTIYSMAAKIMIPADKILVRFAPRTEVPKYLSVSDLSIFFIKPTFSKSASSPTKLGELIAMEIPIICNSGVGDIDTIVKEGTFGIAIKTFSAAEYERAAISLDNLLNIHKDKFPTQQIDTFTLETGVRNYQAVYAALV